MEMIGDWESRKKWEPECPVDSSLRLHSPKVGILSDYAEFFIFQEKYTDRSLCQCCQTRKSCPRSSRRVENAWFSSSAVFENSQFQKFNSWLTFPDGLHLLWKYPVIEDFWLLSFRWKAKPPSIFRTVRFGPLPPVPSLPLISLDSGFNPGIARIPIFQILDFDRVAKSLTEITADSKFYRLSFPSSPKWRDRIELESCNIIFSPKKVLKFFTLPSLLRYF